MEWIGWLVRLIWRRMGCSSLRPHLNQTLAPIIAAFDGWAGRRRKQPGPAIHQQMNSISFQFLQLCEEMKEMNEFVVGWPPSSPFAFLFSLFSLNFFNNWRNGERKQEERKQWSCPCRIRRQFSFLSPARPLGRASWEKKRNWKACGD